MASEAAVSKSTVSKSDIVMIAVLLACAIMIIIESHNRILIGPPADGGRVTFGATRGTDAATGPIEPASRLDQLTAP
jgi:hypothetical protein